MQSQSNALICVWLLFRNEELYNVCIKYTNFLLKLVLLRTEGLHDGNNAAAVGVSSVICIVSWTGRQAPMATVTRMTLRTQMR